MPIIKVPTFTYANKQYTRCWDGKGDNPGGLPRCPPGTGGPGTLPVLPPSPISTNSEAAKLQGRQEWITEVKFVVDGVEKVIDPILVKELEIVEDVFNPFMQGVITVDAEQEGLEREAQNHVAGVDWLTFRNDARDEIILTLKPNLTPARNPYGNGEFPDEAWYFKHKYVIYDKEDTGDSMGYKIKKFYFWDKNYQLMRERRIQWSTGIGTRFITDPPKEPIAHQSDFVRSMLTGEAMASLLWDAGLGEYIDFDNWDWGCTYINYALKAQETVWEALNYIYERHVSTDFNDKCVWSRNRFTRRYQLIPYWKIFELASDDPEEPGPLQREHLFAEQRNDGEYTLDNRTLVYSDRSIISPWKAPLLKRPDDIIDIKANQWGFITNYNFTDMAGIDSSLMMVSKPVHTHWNKKKQFLMHFENNEIEKIREDFIIPYRVDFVLGKFPLYTLNRTKTDQIAIKHKYSLESTLEKESDAKMRLNNGKNETAFADLFLNENMGMTLYGSTHRQSGMFIGVDRIGYSDNDFDWKYCGQWYVTSVTHHMKHNKYVNHINMVKLHAYDEFEYAPDETVI